jgi:hypothetical protein
MVEGQSEQKCPNTDPQKSAQPCGCDEGAKYECEWHRAYTLKQPSPYSDKGHIETHGAKITGIHDSGQRQVFASGSMRDPSTGKIKWSRILFGPMARRWAQHLTTAEAKYPDPKPGVPNFTLISTDEEFYRYKESALRHFMSWYFDEKDEDHASAVFFNINGVEIIKAKMRGEATDNIPAPNETKRLV